MIAQENVLFLLCVTINQSINQSMDLYSAEAQCF